MDQERMLVKDQRVNLFLLEKFLNKHQLEAKDIGQYIPSFFHFNNPDLTIDYLNEAGCEWIDLSCKEINALGYDFFLEYIHPETLSKVFPRFLKFYEKGDTSVTFCDFQRVLNPRKREYTTCLTVTKLTEDLSGFLTITQPLEKMTSLNRKITRLIEEDHYLRKNFNKFESLTKREIEIIKLLLEGFNNPQIAEQLFISRRTVEQHRKNLNAKLSISSFADLFKFGYAFDLV